MKHGSLLTGAKQLANCLPCCEQKTKFQVTTPWKHNKVLQLVSSIHFHRRNTFPFKWTIYWYSVTFSAQNALAGMSTASHGHNGFSFPMTSKRTLLNCPLKTEVITGADGLHNLKAASSVGGSQTLGCLFLQLCTRLLRSPQFQWVWCSHVQKICHIWMFSINIKPNWANCNS